MKPLSSWMSGIWVLAIILGLTGASCTTRLEKSPSVLRQAQHERLAKGVSLTYPVTLSSSKGDQRVFQQPAAEPDAATKATIQAAYGNLPLSFEPNQGQTDEQVKFLSRGSGYTLFLTSTEVVLALRKPHKNSFAPVSGSPTPTENSLAPVLGERVRVRRPDSEPPEQMVLRMKLVGANPNPRIQALEALPGKVNYFIGNDPTKWHTNIPTYAKVQYKDIYPGVDLIYYGNQRQLEYDFVIAPDADPKAIRIAFEGADRIEIDTQGDLILHTEGGEVRLPKPRTYQETNGVKQPVPGGYVLPDLKTQNSELKTQTVGFQVAAYDTSRPLVIDPTLSYSTYLGGSDNDRGYGIAVDSSGNAYITGSTFSTDFPTVNPFQAAHTGNSDAFVAKVNAAGSALTYSTYLGGISTDEGYGITVDADGNAYVTGITNSADFPTVSPLQAAKGAGFDAFVVKLNAEGSAFYSTYLGGSGFDQGISIAVDSSHNAHVVGGTGSTDFPTTAGAFQTTGSGVFVTKFDPTGSVLIYSTYIGSGSGQGIAVDAFGNAYVTGETSSTNFPTASPFQPANGGLSDAFVTKLNAAGSALIYSTYLGGISTDRGYSITVDADGNAYVTGYTQSTDFPTVSPFQVANSGGADAFVTKVSAAGSTLVYSTYLGGSTSDYGYGIAVDSSGNAYVTGFTGSSNFPFQVANSGGDFVTKFNAAGSALVYSTSLGGNYGFDITVDSSGNAYVTGSAGSGFPTTPGAFQPDFGGGIYDAFVAKMVSSADLSITKTDSPDPVMVGNNLTYTITVTNNGELDATDVTVTDTLPTGVTFVSSSTSQGNCSGTSTIICILGDLANSASATVTIVVTSTVAGTLSNTASVTGNETDSNTANNTATAVTTVSSPPTLSVTPTSLDFGSVTVNSTKDLTFTVTNSGDGTLMGSVTASSPFSIVSGDSFSLTAGASQTVTVRFSPTSTGTFLGTANVSSNGGDTAVTLSGTGTPAPSLSVSTTSLDFGNVTVNSTKDLTFTVTNDGGGTLTGSVTASSPFSIVSGSSFSLTAGASQTVTVRFSPTSTGTFTGTATVSSNGGSATVSLSGTGTEEKVPLLLVTPTSLAFGSVTVGSSSDLSFTVTNSGGGTLTGTATTTSPFSIVSGGSFSLAAGATQTVTVRFSPTSTGAFADIVSVSSNGGSASVTLSGTGTGVSNPVLSVFPTALDFGEVALGSSKDLLFTVTNTGTGTLTGTVTASSPFSITSGGSFSLGTGASQTITVRFSPTVESFVSSTAAVNSNGGNAVVTLTGTGTTIQTPLLSVTPPSLDFGGVLVGSSLDLLFFVQNSGGGTLVGTVSTTAPGFSIVSGNSFSLTAGATQVVTVRFSPTEGGTFSGTVTVSSNGGGATVTVTGVGTGVPQPTLTITPSILNFGSVRVGKSKDLSFTLQNTGEGTLAGTATATDPFSVVTNSSFTLEAGELVLVTVRFSPPTTGTFTGTVKFASNGGNVTAAVTGRGRGKLLPFGAREAIVSIAIDIQPNSDANSIDCQSTGKVAVGILNVRELPLPIEVFTLELEGAVAQSGVAEDMDGDGEKDDVVVYFEIQGVSEAACQEGVNLFFLTGELADGTPIEGSDEVTIVRGR